MPNVQIEGVGVVAFPDGMTPEQITKAIETEILPQSRGGGERETDPLRQVALLSRAAAEGVVSTLALPLDMQEKLVGPIRNAILKQFGGSLPDMSPSGLLRSGLDAAGAYNPETSGEEMASAVTRGATAALTGGGVAGVTGAANVARVGVSGATGAGASEFARQQGVGPLGQMAAGLVAGFTPTALEGTARYAAGFARPLTRSGQDQMAGQVLRDQADDPAAAAARLQSAREVLPGSARTTGEASQDIGLMALEKGVRGRNPSAFGERLSEQNVARQKALSDVAGTADDVAAAKSARDATTAPMRERALASGNAADPNAVIGKIDEILASPKGEREVVRKALTEFRDRFKEKTEPSRLYEIRKDIGHAMEGKLGSDKSVYRLAKKELLDVRAVLDDQIEAAAPGFKAYLTRYAELSKPIEQAKVLQEIQRRAQLTSADVTTGQQFLGAASFSRAVDAALLKSGGRLTAKQLESLKAIRTDLQYGQAINSPLIKAPGSDTFQNLSIAQAIGAGRTVSHPAIQALTKPLRWLYSGSDDRVTEILTQAMLDPKLAASMLQRATPKTMGQFSRQLGLAAGGAALGVQSQGASTRKEERAQGSTRR